MPEPAFDARAYIDAMRSIGVTVTPWHEGKSFGLFCEEGFGDDFFVTSERFADSYRADRKAAQRKVYEALCAERPH
ncbi:MAG: hypothetical protein JOZ16_01290 [Methylobacteriaceae bacterium]|nr:hypothetical protein [Methylobacteriaceae bacterium]